MSGQSAYIGAYPSATAMTEDQLPAGIVTEEKLGAVPFINGAARNLAARTHATTPNSQITITAAELVVKNSAGLSLLLSTVAVHPAITTSGENGLDTGAEANSTWYYGWVIAKDDGTTAGLLSTSATSPTLPTGYSYKALVTAVRNDGSGNFLPYRQVHDTVFFYGLIAALSNGGATSATAVNLSTLTPPICKKIKLETYAIVTSGAGAFQTRFTVHYASGIIASYTPLYCQQATTTDHGANGLEVFNLNNEVYYLFSDEAGSAGTRSGYINVRGFTLPIGGE